MKQVFAKTSIVTHILGFHWALHKDTGMLEERARSRDYLTTYA
jgi:hypothetical protein